MKKVFLVLAAFLFAALACTKDSGSGSKSHTDKESESAYDPTVSTINDVPSVSDDKVLKSVISSYKEKVVLVDLWEVWCPNCISANTVIEPLKVDRFKDVAFVYMASESSDRGKWEEQVSGLKGVHYYLSDGQMSAALKQAGSSAFPTFIVAGRDGHIIKTFIGFNQSEMFKTLDDAL